ncbi:unnamed protein product [Psylliodes chrysocephalus]|uniref:Uncharacterized protein n=1 Tax=Psylliodes chrysocephalus TaxID=3402493 RepID=A0A9P0GC06_9CUCU|nr:unnamed protein product [Psylliodes chrysocephala]
MEREKEKQIRKTAKEEQDRRKIVKIGYNKVTIDGIIPLENWTSINQKTRTDKAMNMNNEKIVIDDVLYRQNYTKTIKTNSEKMRGANKAFKENEGNNQNHDQIYLATWNVRSTYAEGTLIRLTQIIDNYLIDLIAVQETKQSENFIKEVGEYIFFNNATDDRMFGTGYLV